MPQFLKIFKKTALSWWFEVDNNGELRTISDFEVNIGNSFNIVEIDGSKIFINNIANITIIDETNANVTFNYIDPFLLEQKLRGLNFVPYRDQSVVTGSGIVDAPAIAGTGNTVITFDEIRYHGLTAQTGNIVLQLNAAPNINKNGRVQVINIKGNGINTLTFPTDWSDTNGVLFDNTKDNAIYLDFVNGKVKFNITKINILDITPPSYITKTIDNVGSNTATFNVRINELGAVKYIVTTSNVAPTKLQITNGIGAVSNNFGVINIINDSIVSVNLNGLSVITPYYLWSYAEDQSNNETSVQGAITFTTTNIVIYAEDDFNSVDIADALGRITQIGNYVWAKSVPSANTLGIVSNKLKLTSGISSNLLINLAKHYLDIRVTIGDATAPSAIFFLATEFSPGTSTCIVNPDLSIVQYVNDAATPLFSGIGTNWVTGDVIRINITGTTTNIITLYRNDVQLYTGTASNALTGNKVGFSISNALASFDKLTIY